ncbi:MAG: adenosylhomocysteinase [Proteobacteria bacterium]|nr:adenosylhomocysteinase [Pseudomonadota bacterium]
MSQKEQDSVHQKQGGEKQDYRVADIGLASLGFKDIFLAEQEMPALMALRQKYAALKPLQGAHIVGCLHMTVETAVLIKTLRELGAEVRWSSCNIFSTQDHAAAAMAADGVAVYAWKGQTTEEAEWCIKQTLMKDGKLWDATMLLDDGGDLTEMVHQDFPEMLPGLHGVSEETTTGIVRLQQLLAKGALKIPAINVNDSVTKSKNDNKYGCRHSLNDALKRATNRLLSGRHALVIGYGDVGKGSAASLRGEGMIVKIAEIDPICAMQACMDGYEVVSPYIDGCNTGAAEDINQSLLASLDLIVTATGNVNVCDGAMLSSLKAGAVVCNIGHFDNEIDTQYLKDHYTWQQIKHGVHKIDRSDDQNDFILLLAEGRLVNLGCATGHPSRVMDGSFANQVIAQIHLWQEKWADKKTSPPQLCLLPKHLDEEVARHMVTGFGGTLTQLTPTQAKYIGVPVAGPFKGDHYRY